MPYTNLLHLEPLSLWQSTADPFLHRRHSNTVLSQSLWNLWALAHTRFVWALSVSLAEMGFDSKPEFTPSYHLAGASPLPLDVGYLFTVTPAPTILLGFLWPWTWGISSQPIQQSVMTAPDLGCGVSLHGCSHKAQLPLPSLDVGLYPQRFFVQIRSHFEVLSGHKFSIVKRSIYSTQYQHIITTVLFTLLEASL